MRVLRPVGEPVGAIGRTEPEPGWPAGWKAAYFRSGTAALGRAIRSALERDPGRRTGVLLPAYGCPDLVAATLWAGGIPRLIDTRPGSPFADPGPPPADVAVVVLPHFLGLRQAIEDWREHCDVGKVELIEDSAQRWPGDGARGLQADLAVLSFGRGKPASGEGGGALLARGPWVGRLADGPPWPLARWPDFLRASLLGHAMQAAMHPAAYGAIAALPGLGLGETRYRPLAVTEAMRGSQALAAAAAMRRASGRLVTQAQRALWSGLERLRTPWRDIARQEGHPPDEPLLRYPLLAPDRTRRDAVLAALSERGLGASAFYGTALPSVRDCPDLDAGRVPHAEDFADRLLTLPLHSAVRQEDCERMLEALEGEGALG